MKKGIGICELVLTALIWGVAFVAQSVGMDYIGPFTFNCVRFFIGGIVLIPLILFRSRKMEEEKNSTAFLQKRKNTIIGGVLCGVLLCSASSFQQFGIMQTSVGKAGFITALYIIIVPLLGIFLHKRVTLLMGISALTAVCGFYLLCISGQLRINRGDLLVLICAFVFSLHILVIDRYSTRGDCVTISCIQFFTSAIISGLCMMIFEKPLLMNIIAAYIPLLYAGVLSCGVAYTLQIVGQKNMDPTVASLILCLESVFSALAGWVILGQKLSSRELVGCILVFLAVILANLQGQLPLKRKKADH